MPLEQPALGARVERGGRLVEDHERRVAEERARERDALPLADGEVVAAGELAAEHRLVALGAALRGSRARPARAAAAATMPRASSIRSCRPEADVLARGEQVALEVLEDDRDRRRGARRGRRRRRRRRPRGRARGRAGRARRGSWRASSCRSRSRRRARPPRPASISSETPSSAGRPRLGVRERDVLGPRAARTTRGAGRRSRRSPAGLSCRKVV